MKAVVLDGFGNVDRLRIEEIKIPAISDDEVLIKVKAISINPVDAKTRKGEALAPQLKDFSPIILGWDVSGIIESAGKNVINFQKGQEVFGMINFVGHGKAYAEYIAAKPQHLAIKPKNVTHAEAAASTLAALTAWQAFTHFGQLKPNDRVLIHAAAGGVGHFAVQIAKHLGAYVIGTSSDKNKNFVFSLGADEHIDYRNNNFEDLLDNIDFVLETIGHENFRKSVHVLKQKGTIINLPSGLNDNDKNAANQKQLNSCFFMTVYSSGDDMERIANLLQEQTIKPSIYKTYDFLNIAEAHLQIESGKTVGKIVIEL